MDTRDYLKSLRENIRFTAPLGERQFNFQTTWGLFSPRELDEGTRLMLQHMEIAPDNDCLDVGCGYGPLGMFMASQAPQGQTMLVDKDFVAINYSNLNLEANGLSNGKAQLSNGFNDIDPALTFDVIASNIPAKVGKELLTLWMHDAKARLNPGGRFYVVTINGLRQFMKRYMQDVFGNYDKLKQGSHYTVAVAQKD